MEDEQSFKDEWMDQLTTFMKSVSHSGLLVEHKI